MELLSSLFDEVSLKSLKRDRRFLGGCNCRLDVVSKLKSMSLVIQKNCSLVKFPNGSIILVQDIQYHGSFEAFKEL